MCAGQILPPILVLDSTVPEAHHVVSGTKLSRKDADQDTKLEEQVVGLDHQRNRQSQLSCFDSHGGNGQGQLPQWHQYT